MAAREATGARSSSTSVSATSTTGFDASAGSPGAAETFATTPSKGARSSLRASWFLAVDSAARAVRTAARADSSCSLASSTSCPAATPAVNACRARSYLVAAFDSCASACPSWASACATASRRGTGSSRASTCPARTCSPSAARICDKRPATTGASFTSSPGSGSSVPATSTVSGTSPRMTGCTRTGTGWTSSAVSPFRWQPPVSASSSATLEIRTDGLLEIGERFLCLQLGVDGPAPRSAEIGLGLEHRDQRGAPDAISLPCHLQHAHCRGDELAPVEPYARGGRGPARTRGENLSAEPLHRRLRLHDSRPRVLLLLVDPAAVPGEQGKVEGDARPQAPVGRWTGRYPLRSQRDGRQGADGDSLLVCPGQGRGLLRLQRLHFRVLSGPREQILFGGNVGCGWAVHRVHLGAQGSVELAVGRARFRCPILAFLFRAAHGQRGLLDLEPGCSPGPVPLLAQARQLRGDLRRVRRHLHLRAGGPEGKIGSPHRRVQPVLLELDLRLGDPRGRFSRADRCPALSQDRKLDVERGRVHRIVGPVAHSEGRILQLSGSLDCRSRSAHRRFGSLQPEVAPIGDIPRFGEREPGSEEGDRLSQHPQFFFLCVAPAERSDTADD